ncbi:MAG: HAMP domain-containing histidine kinase [Mesorhizobium sp.]|uniref:sensor histidine kinase n=1 Tax=Mesorhizobium sp. TaxID=1871066 RepID=UPI000FE52AD4|nr:HAMP domain-containing sensor histidine kinase [Mesorhizobium sp.]RWC01631.1 MAG: HAMP domain-containing histidine kinase [Mesorhizobium sp.]TIS51523.1 MAG: HAMP domain-containing histidine kinase [Mesorhizobium sp.]
MTNSNSMTRKLISWLGGATLLVWIAAPTIAAFIFCNNVNESSDDLLQASAEYREPELIKVLNGKHVDQYNNHLPTYKKYWTYREQVINKYGVVLISEPEEGQQPFPDAPLSNGFWGNADYRVYTEEIQDGVYHQLAEPLDGRRTTIAKGAHFVFLPTLVLLPFSLAVWWIVIRRSLRPIEVLRQQIGSRDGGNLSPMDLGDFPAELAPIAASVNRLLDRLRAALEAEREFAANSAHELRTPIAGSIAQMQRLVAELPNGSAKMRARGIEQALSSLGRLVEKVLQLAQAESGVGMADHAIDLVRSVRLEIDDLRKKPQYAGRLHLNVDGCTTLMRKVDVDAFGILLRNLIENALIHGLPTVPTTVSVQTDGTIAIANAGPVVPLPDLEGLTKRFSRGATPAAGSGLGLHIANMVIQRIGGSLELASPARGRNDGFEAIIRIPQ